MNEKITATEAVYGFASWLTTRDVSVTIGSVHNAAEVADLVKEWLVANNLPDVREGVYPENLVAP